MISIGSKHVVFSSNFMIANDSQTVVHVNVDGENLEFHFNAAVGAANFAQTSRNGGPVVVVLRAGGGSHSAPVPSRMGPLANGTMLDWQYSYEDFGNGGGLVHFYLLKD